MEPNSFDAPATEQPVVPTLPHVAPALTSRKNCLRLRGLPYDADVKAVLGFLGEYSQAIVPQGVHMVYNSMGRPTGEAVVQMHSEDVVSMAVANRHRHYMMGRKPRYIELFPCSIDDINKLLSDAAPIPPVAAGAAPRPASMFGPPGASLTAMPFVYWPYPRPPWSPPLVYLPGVTMVLLRGLPYSATMRDVLAFFRDFPTLTPNCVHIQRNAEGRASGEAVVAFATREEAERAVRRKHRKNIGKRYIEVFIP